MNMSSPWGPGPLLKTGNLTQHAMWKFLKSRSKDSLAQSMVYIYTYICLKTYMINGVISGLTTLWLMVFSTMLSAKALNVFMVGGNESTVIRFFIWLLLGTLELSCDEEDQPEGNLLFAMEVNLALSEAAEVAAHLPPDHNVSPLNSKPLVNKLLWMVETTVTWHCSMWSRPIYLVLSPFYI